MLETIFTSLAEKYSNNTDLISNLWKEIETQHSQKNRYYHSLSHLENLYRELSVIKENITHWDTVLFSLFYHDIIYNVRKQDNEEQSATLAANRMEQLGVPAKIIEACKHQIIATKKHQFQKEADTNYFTDADLSILGAPEEQYSAYAKQVRKEYRVYPNLLYNPGRKKVLMHFLEMECIFKTPHFQRRYEAQAKENLSMELKWY